MRDRNVVPERGLPMMIKGVGIEPGSVSGDMVITSDRSWCLPGESGRGTSPASIVYRPQPAVHPVGTCRVSCFRHDYVPRVCDAWGLFGRLDALTVGEVLIDFVGEIDCA